VPIRYQRKVDDKWHGKIRECGQVVYEPYAENPQDVTDGRVQRIETLQKQRETGECENRQGYRKKYNQDAEAVVNQFGRHSGKNHPR
jgi:hypothetical protein